MSERKPLCNAPLALSIRRSKAELCAQQIDPVTPVVHGILRLRDSLLRRAKIACLTCRHLKVLVERHESITLSGDETILVAKCEQRQCPMMLSRETPITYENAIDSAKSDVITLPLHDQVMDSNDPAIQAAVVNNLTRAFGGLAAIMGTSSATVDDIRAAMARAVNALNEGERRLSEDVKPKVKVYKRDEPHLEAEIVGSW